MTDSKASKTSAVTTASNPAKSVTISLKWGRPSYDSPSTPNKNIIRFVTDPPIEDGSDPIRHWLLCDGFKVAVKQAGATVKSQGPDKTLKECQSLIEDELKAASICNVLIKIDETPDKALRHDSVLSHVKDYITEQCHEVADDYTRENVTFCVGFQDHSDGSQRMVKEYLPLQFGSGSDVSSKSHLGLTVRVRYVALAGLKNLSRNCPKSGANLLLGT